MKYESTANCRRDLKRLSAKERDEFRRCAKETFAPAADACIQGESWPSGLRVKKVQGTTDIWEMTWSFTDPDGRATFCWTKVDGEVAILWRRVGSHAIFSKP